MVDILLLEDSALDAELVRAHLDGPESPTCSTGSWSGTTFRAL